MQNYKPIFYKSSGVHHRRGKRRQVWRGELQERRQPAAKREGRRDGWAGNWDMTGVCVRVCVFVMSM